ncbi:gamma-glutamyl-gamma-aminobutyrate hydrolase family protein [Azospirillum sp.]|uniref:gamma-glutamyl-gamma-aminobutyrate hydrolase family protein n=1 Tax=Azospirillum sp. TaxID=34012 RepID=UPI00261B4901|nr:gamma-glutamyl-gamma-aminobutyrate hydrolase family protein [Azospirillum sp.]
MTPIAITQRVVIDPNHGERRDALDQRWWSFLAACRLLPVPMPNAPEPALMLAERAGVRGLLLTGGDDIGRTPERDETEGRLISWAEERDLPILGVCRGMQMLLTLAGATLEPVSGHVAVRHAVRFGDEMVEVNSYHGLGVRAGAGALEAWGVAEDGVVEAVRHRCRPIVGILWHPEREATFSPRDVAFFKSLFKDHA